MMPREKAACSHLFKNDQLPEYVFRTSEEIAEMLVDNANRRKVEPFMLDSVFLKNYWYFYSTHQKISNFFSLFESVSKKKKIETILIVGSPKKMQWLADYHLKDLSIMLDVLYSPKADPLIFDRRKQPVFAGDHLVAIERRGEKKVVFGSQKIERKIMKIESPN